MPGMLETLLGRLLGWVPAPWSGVRLGTEASARLCSIDHVAIFGAPTSAPVHIDLQLSLWNKTEHRTTIRRIEAAAAEQQLRPRRFKEMTLEPGGGAQRQQPQLEPLEGDELRARIGDLVVVTLHLTRGRARKLSVRIASETYADSSEMGEAEAAERLVADAPTADDARRAALEAVHPQLFARLRPVAPDVAVGEPPIEVGMQTDGVWLHGVALSWRYSTDARWSAEGAACAPSYGVVLPAELVSPRALYFEWPGERPPRVGQLDAEVRVTWGLGSSGPVRTSVAPLQGVNWQYP
jgi:hypothetical protein